MTLLKILVGISLLFKHPLLMFAKFKEAKLNGLESVLMKELSRRLKREFSDILKTQIKQINFIERGNYPKTIITFNRIRKFHYDLKRNKKFPMKTDEYVIEKIDFMILKRRFRAKFYVVYGNIYSIEFTANMSGYFSVTPDDVVFESKNNRQAEVRRYLP